MFHQNIGVNDMDEFPALGGPSDSNQIMQRTYDSTVQGPAYHRTQNYDTPLSHFTRHDFPVLTQQFEPRHDITTPHPSHVEPWGLDGMRMNETSPQVQVQPLTEPSTPSTTRSSLHQDNYKLSDLVSILRAAEPDRTMMAIGNNLSMLRLNLNSPHSIYPNFLSPWSDTQKLPVFAVEPGYYIPASYHEAKASPSAQERLSSFSDDALFYMFYSMPNDVMQAGSAKELFNRNWRYSKGMKAWITRQAAGQGKTIKAIGPISELEQITQGLFIVFDPIQWKREEKELTIVWQTIELSLSD